MGGILMRGEVLSLITDFVPVIHGFCMGSVDYRDRPGNEEVGEDI